MTAGIAGTTNLGQDKKDPDTYESEYGTYTVSVRIVIGKKSLHLLAHELGHVRHQVPDLAAYYAFYTKFSLPEPVQIRLSDISKNGGKEIGIACCDASGDKAAAHQRVGDLGNHSATGILFIFAPAD